MSTESAVNWKFWNTPAGFASIMIGFFRQWPTLVPGLMLPAPLIMHWYLAKREERETEAAIVNSIATKLSRVPRLFASPQLLALGGFVMSTLSQPVRNVDKGLWTMTTHPLHRLLFTTLLLIGTATMAAAQTTTQDHDAHHPADTGATPSSQPAAPGGAPATPMPSGKPGMMGMMTPEMMQMMGKQGGNTGQQGMMMCPMARMMMGMRPSADTQMTMGSSGMLYGIPTGAQEQMTPERVRDLLEQRLARHGNPRLKLGEIATSADGSITAAIVTVDGSLVQKLSFNRYPGWFRQITD